MRAPAVSLLAPWNVSLLARKAARNAGSYRFAIGTVGRFAVGTGGRFAVDTEGRFAVGPVGARCAGDPLLLAPQAVAVRLHPVQHRLVSLQFAGMRRNSDKP